MPPRVSLRPSTTQLQNFLRLRTNNKTPYVDQLSKWDLSKNLYNRQHFRHEVVSEDLIHETLQVLAPSLKQYEGCTIFDCCPGGGLWSRKVHELLQPKAHLILEPDLPRFRPLLDPLVQASNSTYSYEDLTPYSSVEIHGTWKAALSGIAPFHLQNLNSQKIPNQRVLVLANMSQRYGYITTGISSNPTASKAESFVFQFLQLLTAGNGPHMAGPARLLIWLPNEEKGSVVPRNIVMRRGTATQVEELFDVQEVVGGLEYYSQKRFAELDIQSAMNAGSRVRDVCQRRPELFTTPTHRRTDLNHAVMRAVTKPEGKFGALIQSLAPDKPTIDGRLGRDLLYFEQQERRFYDGEIPKTAAVKGKDKRFRNNSKEYEELLSIRQKFEELVNDTNTLDHLAHRRDDVGATALALSNQFEAERQLALAQRTSGDIAAAESKLTQCKAKATHLFSKLVTRGTPAKVANEIDNIQALHHDPPLLAWDQRKREPLETFADEFWLPQKLALLDLQPRVETKAGVGSVYADLLFRNLRTMDTLPIEQALEGVAHGAAEAVLPHCASLRDPLKGGRLDLKDLRVRMLTHGMARELNEAWERWELKPDEHRLIGRLSGKIEL